MKNLTLLFTRIFDILLETSSIRILKRPSQISTMERFKAVNYFHKKCHHRGLTGS